MTAPWENILHGLKTLPPAQTQSPLELTIERLCESLPADCEAMRSISPLIFAGDKPYDEDSASHADLLKTWAQQGTAPHLPSFCIEAVSQLSLSLTRDLECALMMACVLGEIPNDLPYHNNMHVRKVMWQLLRLISAHNHIMQDTAYELQPRQIALLMMAAAVHDYGHDGRGNIIKGVLEPSRLERLSLDGALPLLKAAGLDEPAYLNALNVMVLGTDVSPPEDPANPMKQMKAAYRHHFHGEYPDSPLNLDEELKPLERDKMMALMSLLLHEADIATSAGLNYEITQYETFLLHEELGRPAPRPSDIIAFLNQICQRRFLSHAGQELYAANMARILALAEEDLAAGDHEFDSPDFAVLPRSGVQGDRESRAQSE